MGEGQGEGEKFTPTLILHPQGGNDREVSSLNSIMYTEKKITLLIKKLVLVDRQTAGLMSRF